MCIIVREWQIGLNEERSQQRISSVWGRLAELRLYDENSKFLQDVSKTYAKANGKWVYLYRAIDEYGETVDFLLRTKRDRTPIWD